MAIESNTSYFGLTVRTAQPEELPRIIDELAHWERIAQRLSTTAKAMGKNSDQFETSKSALHDTRDCLEHPLEDGDKVLICQDLLGKIHSIALANFSGGRGVIRLDYLASKPSRISHSLNTTVLPEYKGAGTLLVKEVAKKTLAGGVADKIEISCFDESRPFFHKLGFHQPDGKDENDLLLSDPKLSALASRVFDNEKTPSKPIPIPALSTKSPAKKRARDEEEKASEGDVGS